MMFLDNAGGPGAAHEAEQFIWNDNIVIPVVVTGGAAGGKFGIPSKISLVRGHLIIYVCFPIIQTFLMFISLGAHLTL